MHVTVTQPYFLPYIGSFELVSTVDKIGLLDDVNFINRWWDRSRLRHTGQERPCLSILDLLMLNSVAAIREATVKFRLSRT